MSPSKHDKMYKDVITVAVSGSTDIADDISHFVDIGNKECFAPLLYVCFDQLRLDVVEELSWQRGLNDFYIPYNIQAPRTICAKLVALEKRSRNAPKRNLPESRKKLRLRLSTLPFI